MEIQTRLSKYTRSFGTPSARIKLYDVGMIYSMLHFEKYSGLKNFEKGLSRKRPYFKCKKSNGVISFESRPGCSVNNHEEMNEHTIIKTHKELFCRRCEVYDCGVHGILDVSFLKVAKYLRML